MPELADRHATMWGLVGYIMVVASIAIWLLSKPGADAAAAPIVHVVRATPVTIPADLFPKRIWPPLCPPWRAHRYVAVPHAFDRGICP